MHRGAQHRGAQACARVVWRRGVSDRHDVSGECGIYGVDFITNKQPEAARDKQKQPGAGVHMGAQGRTGVHWGTLGRTGLHKGASEWPRAHRGAQGCAGVHPGSTRAAPRISQRCTPGVLRTGEGVKMLIQHSPKSGNVKNKETKMKDPR